LIRVQEIRDDDVREDVTMRRPGSRPFAGMTRIRFEGFGVSHLSPA